jgi:uncharacterized protein (DUF885 family)
MHRRAFSTALLAATAMPGFAYAHQAASVEAQSEDARLAAFFRKADDEHLELSPEAMTFRGLKRRYGELRDHSRSWTEQTVALSAAQVAQMKKEFDRTRLSPAGRLSYDIFERLEARGRGALTWYWQTYAVTSGGSSLDNIPTMLITRHVIDTTEDAEAYVSRLRAMERVAVQVAEELDERTSRGLLPPGFVFGRVIPDAKNQIQGAPFDNGPDQAVWADLKKKVARLAASAETKARLLRAGQEALLGEWRRGYIRYLQALTAMSKKATTSNGVWALPDGAAYYADRVKFHTTTDLAPEEIHEIGLSETARLKRQMIIIKDTVGFRGTLEEFQDHIRSDPQFRYPNTDAGRDACLADAKKRVGDYMAVANTQFITLPSEPLEIRRVETFRERTGPVVPAYQAGAPGQPGIVYFNLSDMAQVLKPQLPALTFHEGAPGHHFQLSRQHALSELPDFRRFLIFTAYSEGWGLYAEGLAKDAGFYRDPFEEFGRLSLEIWRAVRLVLDTGIHAKRWSREQAVDYMRRNTLNSERDVQGEIDRYFTDPGQATGYKIGQMKFLALRQKAANALGNKYNIRDFHEIVLRNGALPLDMLEAQVDAYIRSQ